MSAHHTTLTTTETPELITWMSGKDDYGRSTHHLYRESGGWGTKGVVVRLPKAAIARRTDGAKYLVNNWTLPQDAPGKVTHHRTLAAAKAHLLAATTF